MKEWIEDAWLNLSEKEVEELRYNKQELTKYGREKIRALMLKYDNALRKLAE
jgi:hypothetical protein